MFLHIKFYFQCKNKNPKQFLQKSKFCAFLKFIPYQTCHRWAALVAQTNSANCFLILWLIRDLSISNTAQQDCMWRRLCPETERWYMRIYIWCLCPQCYIWFWWNMTVFINKLEKPIFCPFLSLNSEAMIPTDLFRHTAAMCGSSIIKHQMSLQNKTRIKEEVWKNHLLHQYQ